MLIVKFLRELVFFEDVIDIKLELDDFIDEDFNFVQENFLFQKKFIVIFIYGFFCFFIEIY